MTLALVDCPTGLAGDMLLAALFDLGLDEAVVHRPLRALGLEGRYRLESAEGRSGGLRGLRLRDVDAVGGQVQHGLVGQRDVLGIQQGDDLPLLGLVPPVVRQSLAAVLAAVQQGDDQRVLARHRDVQARRRGDVLLAEGGLLVTAHKPEPE